MSFSSSLINKNNNQTTLIINKKGKKRYLISCFIKLTKIMILMNMMVIAIIKDNNKSNTV